LNHGTLKSLGDELESRVRWLQGWPHTHSCESELLDSLLGVELHLLYVPTLTEVFPSSSEALLPPPALLVVLIRLLVRGGLIMALTGRWGSDMPEGGDPGGELAMAL